MQAEQVHAGVRCDGCGVCPIKGMRYKCNTCVDFDFCSTCNDEKAETMHANGGHLFTQIRKPRPYGGGGGGGIDRSYAIAKMLSATNGRKPYGGGDDSDDDS